MSLFMASNGHWMRMIRACDMVAERYVEVQFIDPPMSAVRAQQYSTQVCLFIARNMRGFHLAFKRGAQGEGKVLRRCRRRRPPLLLLVPLSPTTSVPPSKASAAKMIRALGELQAVFNSEWYRDPLRPDAPLIHYCRDDGTCCPGATRELRTQAAKARFARAVRAAPRSLRSFAGDNRPRAAFEGRADEGGA